MAVRSLALPERNDISSIRKIVVSCGFVSFKVNSRILMMDGKDEETKKEEFYKKNVKKVNRVN